VPERHNIRPWSPDLVQDYRDDVSVDPGHCTAIASLSLVEERSVEQLLGSAIRDSLGHRVKAGFTGVGAALMFPLDNID